MHIFSLKEMLAKKKAFSVSVSNDEEIIQIQSEVDNLLNDLDNEPTNVIEKDSFSEQLERIDTLLTAVDTTILHLSCPPEAKLMGENDMEMLIDNILGVESEPSLPSNRAEHELDSGSQIEEFEKIIGRMETSEVAADDLFDDEPSDLRSVKDKKLFPVFIKGATEKNQR